MNKTELLADISGKTFIGWVADPVLQNADPAGFNWYAVRVREGGTSAMTVGLYHQIHFYVDNEGEADEVAFYQNDEPFKSFRTREFKKWIQEQYENDLESYEGLVLLRIDELAQSAYYSVLEPDPVVTSALTQNVYYIRRFSGNGAKKIEDYNPTLVNGSDIERG